MVEERHSVQQEGGREKSNFAAMGVGLSLDPAVGWSSIELDWVCGERYTMCSRREVEKQFFAAAMILIVGMMMLGPLPGLLSWYFS